MQELLTAFSNTCSRRMQGTPGTPSPVSTISSQLPVPTDAPPRGPRKAQLRAPLRSEAGSRRDGIPSVHSRRSLVEKAKDCSDKTQDNPAIYCRSGAGWTPRATGLDARLRAQPIETQDAPVATAPPQLHPCFLKKQENPKPP